MLKFDSSKQNIYFSSDFHYNHSNYCRGTSKWSDTSVCRDFNILEEMNQFVIECINSQVGENDILFHLGDWSFGGIESIWNLRKQIKCKTIYNIFGNHDHFIENNNRELPNCKRQTLYSPIIIDGRPSNDSDYCDYVMPQDLFKEVHEFLKIKINKQVVVLSHYPIQEWFEMDKGSIHLCGHCHGKFNI